VIKLVVLDIDGALTDGHLYLDESASEGKSLFYRDFDAISEAQSKGISLALLTGEDRPLCQVIADRLNIQRLAQGFKDKVKGIRLLAEEFGLERKEIAFVGDSDRDARAFAEVGLSFAPADGSPLARALATLTLHAGGGKGAVAEALGVIFKLNELL
jgi:3-deoxy-D-manno-octulosonate 8-phosphate phosphatase (KDO 8-P phosphatase)